MLPAKRRQQRQLMINPLTSHRLRQRMILRVAKRPAEISMAVRCTRSNAPAAEKTRKCLFSRQETDRSIAVIAICNSDNSVQADHAAKINLN